MAGLSAKRKEDLATRLDVVATWVGGPRKTEVEKIAAELRGEDTSEDETPDPKPGPDLQE